MKKILGIIATCFVFASCSNSNRDFDASGTFEATEVIVSSEATGKIMELNLQEGQILKIGKVVGRIDSTQLYLKKLQLQANTKSIQSRKTDIVKQIAATKEQVAKAETERKRNENLLKDNASTQKQLDDINSQIKVLRKQLEAQVSTLQRNNTAVSEESSAMQIQVAQVEDQLQKCRIVSPINGTVLAKYAETGELATPGKPLFKVADIEKLYLRAYIIADQLTQLKLGQEVRVYADYGENAQKEYTGRVTWISDKAEFTPKTIQTKDERANLVYAVKIAIKNDGYIKIGMYGEVRINK